MRQLADRGTIRPLLDLVRTGAWKAYFLGVALDPLTLKPEIMVVSCIDRKRFLDAVGGLLKNRRLPDGNDEGQLLLGPKGWGETLSRANAERYRDDVNTLPAGRGCIELFLEQAEEVLSGHSIQMG